MTDSPDFWRSALTSRQKRAVFKKRMGELLFPCGFLFKKGVFVRVHPGQALLVVGMQLYRGEKICFDAYPFCEDNTNNDFIIPPARRAEDYRHLKGEEFMRTMFFSAFEDKSFEMRYQLFLEYAYPMFKDITDAASLLAFEEEYSRLLPWHAQPMRCMLLCVQLGAYEKAIQYTEDVLEVLKKQDRVVESNLLSERRNGPECNDRLVARCESSLRSNAEKAKRYRGYIDAMKTGHCEELEAIVRDNIARTDKKVRETFPEFY